MQVRDGHASFSPSDLNGLLSCPHPTALQVAVARDELVKPFRVNLHADLIRRKGESTDRYSTSYAPKGSA